MSWSRFSNTSESASITRKNESWVCQIEILRLKHHQHWMMMLLKWFVKLKSQDWNICSSVAHPPPLCISSRVPVNPTCVSSQTLCFILYILFKPLPVSNFLFFLHILPNTSLILFAFAPFQTTASRNLFLFKKINTCISSQTSTWRFSLYTFISFIKPRRVHSFKKKARAYVYNLSEPHQATKPWLV